MKTIDIATLKEIFEAELENSLRRPYQCDDFHSKRLYQSMAYALLGAGKRLRPMLVLCSAIAHSREPTLPHHAIKRAMPGALAVEYIHTYSLIHDDLPAMDDDDFRRGKLTVHRRFDEGLAILAGDALLADAFYLIAKSKLNQELLIAELAKASGSRGLVAGQAEDLRPERETFGYDYWLKINAAKTARLFEACAVIGALSVGADKEQITASRKFGRSFGMAFQIKDDMDDHAGIASVNASKSLGEMLLEHQENARLLSAYFNNNGPLVDLLNYLDVVA